MQGEKRCDIIYLKKEGIKQRLAEVKLQIKEEKARIASCKGL